MSGTVFVVLSGSILAALLPVLQAQAPGKGMEGALPAFPGAEGFGSSTRGGRGGRVLAVTNLDPSGAGSLLEACRARGPRIVVFRAAVSSG